MEKLDKFVLGGAYFGLAALGILIGYFIVAGLWWIILWSFEFPIIFAWKNVIGIIVLIFLFGSSATFKKQVSTYKKEKDE